MSSAYCDKLGCRICNTCQEFWNESHKCYGTRQDLIRKVDALESLVEDYQKLTHRYKDALEFYASHKVINGVAISGCDEGAKAREALKEKE